mgnify:CR=1 FL=1
MVVTDNSGNLVDRDEDDADGTDAQVYFLANNVQTYTVYVSAGFGQTGGYTLFCDFIRTVTAVETEPNNSIAQTDDIAHLDRLLGTVSSSGDTDFFRFFAGAGDVVTVSNLTASGNDNTPNPARDLQIEIQNGAGTVIATPQFTQKVVGSTTLAGLPALRLVDDGAVEPMPANAKSVVAIDQGRLRFGAAGGARDGEGYPATLEAPADAYVRRTPSE